MQPVGMLIRIGDGNDLVGLHFPDKRRQTGFHGRVGADDRRGEPAVDSLSLPLIPKAVHGLHRRQQFHGLVAHQAKEALLRGREKMARGGVCFRNQHRHGHYQVRLR